MDGILVVAKPVGPTSHDVVGLVRRLAATKRVGHGGTLDPFASGVLPVFLGKATRLVEYHLGDRKRYRATVCFGATSTTDDLEGALTPVAGPAADAGDGRGGARRLPRRRSSSGRPPTARSRSPAGGPTRWPGPARRSSSRRGRSRSTRSTLVVVGRRRPPASRSRSSTSTARRGPTSGRWPAISAPRSATRRYLGALVRTASGPFTLDDGDRARRRPRGRRGRAGGGRGAAPADRRRPRPADGRRPGRRRSSRSAAARRSACRPGRGRAAGRRADPPRRRGAAGSSRSPGSPGRSSRPTRSCSTPPAGAARGVAAGMTIRTVTGGPRSGPTTARSSSSIGVFDGLHLGHAWLLEHLVREARLRERPAGRHHLRRAPGRGPARPGAAAPDGSRGAPRAARGARRRGRRDRALRRRPAADAVRRLRPRDHRPDARSPGS